jgi:large subunit ribosomal protein L17
MKHRVAGRKLGRTSAHRLAVLRNLSTDLFRHERIQTTLMKAKELRPFAERLITLGKTGDIHARRRVARHIHDGTIARKLVETLSTRFAERPGGYTRIIKLGPRRGDSAEMAIIELIGSEPTFAPKEDDRKERGRLGRIRERLSRRKSAPEKDSDEAEDAAESAPGKGKPKAKKAAPAPKTKKAKAPSSPAGKKPSKTGGGPRKGGQSPKKGG